MRLFVPGRHLGPMRHGRQVLCLLVFGVWGVYGLLLGAAVVTGCTPSRDLLGDGGNPTLPDGGSAYNQQGVITITPNPINLVVGATQQLVGLTAQSNVYGNVTHLATWSLSNPSLGSVSASGLTVPAGLTQGGSAVITATLGVQTGSATLNVKLKAPDLIDPSAPPNPQGYFNNTTGGPVPSWVYPLDNTMLPRNQGQIDLQWTGQNTAKAYKIHIDSATFTQDIYVGPALCSGLTQCQFQAPDAAWTSIAQSIAGNTATVTLSAGTGPGQPTGSAPPLSMSFSPEDVKGGLYYWSTTITGIYRVPLGAKSATVFINRGNQFGCSGCHAVSRDGKMVALEFGSADGVGGGVVQGTSGTTYLITPPSAGQWNLETFSPDGSKLLVNWQGAGRVINPTSGAMIATVPAATIGRMAQPEWSPDGNSIVFVHYPTEGSGPEWMAANTGDIMIMPWNNGNFGTPQMIVPSVTNTEYHFYPSWTPDSQWIIFDTGTVPCNGTGTSGCNNYNASNTRLRIVRALPNQKPIDLTQATHLANSTTNWPRVAPFVQNNGNLVFFTFSANFPYGFVKTATNPQVWMAGVDLGRAAAHPDQDPSFAPFWLPFQQTTENNHLATWTTDVACNTNSDCPAEFQCIANACVPILG